MLFERFDGGERQHRHQRETHVGAVQRFHHRQCERARQTLAAISGIGGKALPSALAEGLVSVPEAGRSADNAVLQFDAGAIAAPIERREHIPRERAGAVEDGGENIFIDVRIALAQAPEICGGFERKAHVGDGSSVGHEASIARRGRSSMRCGRRAAAG